MNMRKIVPVVLLATFIALPGWAKTDPCLVQSDGLVGFMPGLAKMGIENGTALMESETRLLLIQAVFLHSSCQLASPGNCDKSAAFPREHWLATLAYSGLLLTCFGEDVDEYSTEQVAIVENFKSRAPAETQSRLVAQAMSELGWVPEVSK